MAKRVKDKKYSAGRSSSGKVQADKVKKAVDSVYGEVSKAVIGQKEVVRDVVRAILCDGHVLVEGVPGIAKTLLVKSIAIALGCDSKRIQFTVDLLPTDITGIQSYHPKRGFEIVKGPVFANFILADEINRSPPKSQSALLEAMQEKKVTIAKKTYDLPLPFFVMATENPLENSGVYDLPEAQVDRFLFQVLMGYPHVDEEISILEQNMTLTSFEELGVRSVLSPKKLISLQNEVKKVYASDVIKKYIVEIVNLTRKRDQEFSKYVSYGASPRASIAMFIAAKAEALMKGRDYVIPSDVVCVAYPVLRHRLILNYQAEAEKVSSDTIIKKILNVVRAP